MKKWRMRTAIKIDAGGCDKGRLYHRLALDCGHVVTPIWNGRTFYIKGETKSRCYECAGR